MSHNTFGHLFRVTTWGESHGPALGCVVDGCPPGIRFRMSRDPAPISTSRRPGQSRYRHAAPGARCGEASCPASCATRADPDMLVTTGTPVSMMIDNVDQRSKDYGEIKSASIRPGHADYTYQT
jgi:chorismate synthase